MVTLIFPFKYILVIVQQRLLEKSCFFWGWAYIHRKPVDRCVCFPEWKNTCYWMLCKWRVLWQVIEVVTVIHNGTVATKATATLAHNRTTQRVGEDDIKYEMIAFIFPSISFVKTEWPLSTDQVSGHGRIPLDCLQIFSTTPQSPDFLPVSLSTSRRPDDANSRVYRGTKGWALWSFVFSVSLFSVVGSRGPGLTKKERNIKQLIKTFIAS